MTATEELRRMLDERGVEYQAYQLNQSDEATAWDLGMRDARYEVFARFEEFDRGTLLSFWNCTPAQAVDATLGRGTCRIMTCDNLNELGGDVWLECDACHWQMPLEPSTPRFSFCPNCGREVGE